jgi:hypothetical protein
MRGIKAKQLRKLTQGQPVKLQKQMKRAYITRKAPVWTVKSTAPRPRPHKAPTKPWTAGQVEERRQARKRNWAHENKKRNRRACLANRKATNRRRRKLFG